MASLGASPAPGGGVKERSHSNVVSLCWSNHWQSLTDGLWSICSQNQFVDLNVTCHGDWILAHKLVFAVFSPVLRDSFRETAATSQGLSNSVTGSVTSAATSSSSTTETLNLDLVSTQGEVIPYLIEFIYKGHVTLPTKHLKNLLSIAESLQIKGLMESIKHLPPEIMSDKDESVDGDVEIPTATFFQDDEVVQPTEDAGDEESGGGEPLGILIASVASCRDFDESSTEPETILSDVGTRDEIPGEERPPRELSKRLMCWPNKVQWLSVNADVENITTDDRLRKELRSHLLTDMTAPMVVNTEEGNSRGIYVKRYKADGIELQDFIAPVHKHNNSSPRRNIQWRRKRKTKAEMRNCDRLLRDSSF